MGMGSAPKSAVVHSHSARSTMTHVQQEGGEDDKAKHSNFLAAEPRSGHYDSSHGGSGSYGDGYGDSYGDSGGYGARDKDEFFSGAASSYSKSGGGGSGGASFGSRTDKAGSGGGYSSSSSRGGAAGPLSSSSGGAATERFGKMKGFGSDQFFDDSRVRAAAACMRSLALSTQQACLPAQYLMRCLCWQACTA